MATPAVLLLSWRRPELTEQILAAIAEARPARLFLACDGWNPDTPLETVAAIRATRAILDRQPDWPCSVERRYIERNLGLRRAVSGALDWFFAEVEEGIVLEDDCLPHPDFFGYCEQLLERYRDDPRVMCISGDGSSQAPITDGSSYAFIRWPLVWGWASWRRAWQQYDHDLDRVAALPESVWVRAAPDPDERRVWQERLHSLRVSGRPDTWDYVWALSILSAGGFCTLPGVNLVSNIGFGVGATHTHGERPGGQVPVAPILPLRHPSAMKMDERASRVVFDEALGGASERLRFRWERTMRGRFRRLLHRLVTSRLPRSLIVLVRRGGERRPWIED